MRSESFPTYPVDDVVKCYWQLKSSAVRWRQLAMQPAAIRHHYAQFRLSPNTTRRLARTFEEMSARAEFAAKSIREFGFAGQSKAPGIRALWNPLSRSFGTRNLPDA